MQSSQSRYFCAELEQNLATRSANLSDPLSNETNDLPQNRQRQVQLIEKKITSQIIGRYQPFESPYGQRRICYADYTASSKSLECIEAYIRQEVMPLYANTHTTTSITGLQSTCFRHESRQIIAQSVNAKITGKNAEDCVLFAGQGTTSIVNMLCAILGINNTSRAFASSERPIVFVGPFEHHSNLIPWRESVADVVTIRENDQGQVDLQYLEKKLKEYASRPLRIGAFSAASNVTGVLSSVDAISVLLHRNGALAFWDYASAAPYINMDMNPMATDSGDQAFIHKDAIYFSGHKFIGGPGSPGVLIIKKQLLANRVPSSPGGGTVFFVTSQDHRYLSNREEREEGGTPDILASVRLSLAFEIKRSVGTKIVESIELENTLYVRQALQSNANVILLGPSSGTPQLPIFSFLIRFRDRFLHYNFVCALLNDLFGIQSRGGCACAGPYSIRILGIQDEAVYAIERALLEKKELLRPGFTRISTPYFVDRDQIQFIVSAIHFVANEGWKLLHQYRFNHKSGEWKHVTRFTKFPHRKWLSDFLTKSLEELKPTTGVDTVVTLEERKAYFDSTIECARELVAQSISHVNQYSVAESHAGMLQAQDEKLRWFVYPSEALNWLPIHLLNPTLEAHILPLVGPVQPHQYRPGSVQVTFESLKPKHPQEHVSHKEVPASAPSFPKSDDVAVSARDTRKNDKKYPLRSADLPNDAVCNIVNVHGITTAMSETLLASQLFPKPDKKLIRSVGQALQQWNMIQDGDRLLLGLSGGKDSQSLIHILLYFQKRAPIKFHFACATVDPQTPSYDPSPLKQYMKALGLEYHYLQENIIERAGCELSGDSLCSYCSRMKRGLLYSCCRYHKYNKLVLAQHLDDLAESFCMSLFHNGQLRTMKAKYYNDSGDIQIIRPLVYVREKQLKAFAAQSRLPIINENCPACFEQPKERARVKKMLAQEESLFPQVYHSIQRALLPLMDDSVYDTLETARALRSSAKTKKMSNGTKAALDAIQ